MTPTYITWLSMKQRCYNNKYTSYFRYGGRGIDVCDRWRYSFINFYEDMGERPENMTLDRIDNNKGYYKKNCRWSTKKEQANNTRKTRFININGKDIPIQIVAEMNEIKISTINSRLRNDLCLEDILCKGRLSNIKDNTRFVKNKDLILETLNLYTNKQNKMIKIRFGIDGCGLRTQEDTAQILNCTHQNIQKMENVILKRLDKYNKLSNN